jgi:Neuraminidase (sialidase)
LLTTNALAASNSGPVFQAQTRVGFTVGDQWEPAIAADAFGHVYILFPQYTTIPGCPTCPSPTMFLIVSNDNGKTWSAPNMIADPGSGQVDVQIKVDPADGRTVYASWLQNNKSLIEVAKSTNFGVTWAPR